jgi:hypothetical protein
MVCYLFLAIIIDFDTQTLLTPNRFAISDYDLHSPEARRAANTRPASVVLDRGAPMVDGRARREPSGTSWSETMDAVLGEMNQDET